MGKIYEALEIARKDSRIPQHIEPAVVTGGNKSESEKLIILRNPDSPIAECFRFLRGKLMHPAAGNPPRAVLVTSALMGEGKTFVACNLAVSISQSLEEHVLLIDADIRNPSVHNVFGTGILKEGLSTYLAGDLPLATVLKKTDVDKLTVLPAGNSTVIPAELLSSQKMKLFIREVRDRYPDRFVIIDSPPLELTPESSVIANEVDAVILVVRHGKTPRQAVRDALGKIQREKLLGIVYNGYDEPLKFYNRYGYHKYGYGQKKS